jgi:hypothetical protein
MQSRLGNAKLEAGMVPAAQKRRHRDLAEDQ